MVKFVVEVVEIFFVESAEVEQPKFGESGTATRAPAGQTRMSLLL